VFETIGVPELLIILAIVMLLFGAGKVSRLGKDLGTSVKEFRRAMSDEEGDANPGVATVIMPGDQLAMTATPADAAPAGSQPRASRQIF
jgi:sec-independent protein translocase protein TatA